ncbi:MAG: GNAT family N-acetyltransferase [Candidatus Babeliales bacterium]|nr:GNAT family N-acetyltransferase [Candidatus Babeliales bacterium]
MKKLFLMIFLFNCYVFGSQNLEDLTQIPHINFEYNNLIYRIETELINNKYFTFNLYIKNQSLGYLTIRQEENCYFISYIYIYKDFRNKKLAGLLLENVCSYLNSQGIYRIELLPYPNEFKEGSPEFTEIKERLYKYYSKFGFTRKKDSDRMEKQIR